jgi:hypothetical protein
LIRLGATRDISQAIPIAGNFIGASDGCVGITINE